MTPAEIEAGDERRVLDPVYAEVQICAAIARAGGE
jgi:hypothetical protein